jgi:hypothetical protein
MKYDIPVQEHIETSIQSTLLVKILDTINDIANKLQDNSYVIPHREFTDTAYDNLIHDITCSILHLVSKNR